MEDFIFGRNTVLEAIKSGRTINKILVAKGEHYGSIREILAHAKVNKIIVNEVMGAKLDEMAKGIRHQGVAAFVAPVEYQDFDSMLSEAFESDESPILVLLDEIQDPHNFGAILRSCDATGVKGVIIPKRRSCPLSQAVAKTSSGAIEYVPVARVTNIAQTIKILKQKGFWIVGADMNGDKKYFDADMKGPLVIVIGSEGEGISRLTKESCDFLVQIPMKGRVTSLNASVAGSLLLYEALRQREMKA